LQPAGHAARPGGVGTRKTVWSLDETIRSVSADQYRERFR